MAKRNIEQVATAAGVSKVTVGLMAANKAKLMGQVT
jgi:hypothetical protein